MFGVIKILNHQNVLLNGNEMILKRGYTKRVKMQGKGTRMANDHIKQKNDNKNENKNKNRAKAMKLMLIALFRIA